jgi:hypothetical protein
VDDAVARDHCKVSSRADGGENGDRCHRDDFYLIEHGLMLLSESRHDVIIRIQKWKRLTCFWQHFSGNPVS